MKTKVYIAVFIQGWFLTTSALCTQAQSAFRFSQWFNAPLLTNPANTGFIPDADYRVGANYRNQYALTLSMPFQTFGIWGDAQLFREKISSGWIGAGGMILKDVAGSGGSLSSTRVYGSLAYHQMIGFSHLLSFGVSAGWANKRINASQLIFPVDFKGFLANNNKYDFASSYTIPNNNINYVDVQAGLNYAFFPSNTVYINSGLSAWYLNRPRESFYPDDVPGYNPRIAPRYSFFTNASVKMNNEVILNPMTYFSIQNKAKEFLIGANLQYNLSGNGEKQLYGGLYARPGDAIIPMIGFELNFLRIQFTYDITTNGFGNFNNFSTGSYEFSLMRPGFYNLYKGNRRQTLCPSFY
jgi:type IX secretion system PorP/SprF family membrane protein